MSMPRFASKPVLLSANCVSTSAAAQGSSFAITISGTSSDAASSLTRAYCSAPTTSSSDWSAGNVPFAVMNFTASSGFMSSRSTSSTMTSAAS